jgi:hypothetical protein
MTTAEALALMIALTRELNALAIAYKAARDDGRDELTEAETDTFSVRADASLSRLQAKIDSLS